MQISAIALPFCREYLIHVLQSIGPWKLHQDGRIIYFHEFIYYLLVKYQKTSIALYTISLILLKEWAKHDILWDSQKIKFPSN